MPVKKLSFSKIEHVQGTPDSHSNSLLSNVQIFLPVSAFMIFWYFLVLIVVLISFGITVLYICFESQQIEDGFEDIVLPVLATIMCLDIIISFNTSFIKNGRVILERKQIAVNYVFSVYFVLDLIALIISLVQTVFKIDFEDEHSFLNFLIYIKIIKVVEFDTLIKKYVLKSASQLLYYQMAKNLILLALVCHVVGSFFFYLDIVLIRDKWYSHEELWIYNTYAFLDIADLGVGWQYAYGFYYAVVTLSGTAYGDLVPLNPTETAYTCFSVALPMIIYAYLFAVIYNAISERRSRALEVVKYKKMAKYYFRDMGLDQRLTQRLMNYLSYVYDKRISLDNDFLKNLAPNIRDEYIQSTVMSSYDFSLFTLLSRPECEISQIQALIYNIIREQYFPDKHIISPRKQKIKLYFVNAGSAFEVVELNHKKYTRTVESKQFLMQHPFFTGLVSMKGSHWYEPKEFTITQTIDLGSFMKEVTKNQPLKESYAMLKEQILFNGCVSPIKTKCFFCDETEHVLNDCPRLRLQVNTESVLKRTVRRNEISHCIFFYRRDYHKRKSFFMSGSRSKIELQAKMVSFREICVNSGDTELCKEVQTIPEGSRGDRFHGWGSQQQPLESINNWRIYNPSFNFSIVK